MRVGVIGTGYVGLVTGACLANMGNEVVCHDIDADKIAALRRGEVPIYEPGLEELVRHNVEGNRLAFTTDSRQVTDSAEVCFIAVGTPPDEDGSADRSHVFSAVRAVAEAASGPLVVAVKSTVPVGTCLRVQAILDEVKAARGLDFPLEVVSNPEFLKEGNAIKDFVRPDRLIVGSHSARASDVMRNLYSHFIRNGHRYLEMDLCSSEMSKYAANAMLATRISFMNELAQICERVGADIMEVRRGVGSDTRIGQAFLYPGVGYGGSCFPKDVSALSRMATEAGCPANILDAVERVNRYQKVLLANRIIDYFGGSLKGLTIGIWGLSFKPKTDDIRQAPSLVIIKRLAEAGATLQAFDPQAAEHVQRVMGRHVAIRFTSSLYEAAEGADAIALVTEWAMFRKPDFERVARLMKRSVFFDGRNQYEPRIMAELGFDYHSLGRGVHV